MKGNISIGPNYPKHSKYPSSEYNNQRKLYPDTEDHLPCYSKITEEKEMW